MILIRPQRVLLLGIVWLLQTLSAVSAQAQDESLARQLEFFESKIRPVLVTQCYECHNSQGQLQGGLAVDFRDGLLIGGDSGPSVVPGDADDSLLVQVVLHELDGMEMPKNAPPLSAQEIEDFKTWINNGAVDPRDHAPTAEELASQTSWEVLRETRKQLWSFQPILEREVPAVQNFDWSKHPIDQFLISKMEEQQLQPTVDANATILLRRTFYTLIGLPPTPAEFENWIPRLSEADFEKRQIVMTELVDELLARDEFGEHWGRHWLDWLRYAESYGSEGDPQIPGAWQYRDYIVRAFNSDVPYDQLVRESIAGDLLQTPRYNSELKINESMIGPAHWRMVFHGFTPTDALDEKVRFVDDEINVFSKAFLGLTVSCARCHNHKFDAISQADYFALYGIVGGCRLGQQIIDHPDVQQTNLSELESLKSKIQQELSGQWQAALSTHREFVTANTDKPNELNQGVATLLQPELSEAEFKTRLESLQAQVQADKEAQFAFLNAEHLRNWNLRKSEDSNSWFKFGLGAENGVSQSGQFTVALTGDRLVDRIFEAGLYTHQISSKHPAAIGSPVIELEGEYALWMRICGDGGAVARYVVHDYPRNGLIFPIANPTPAFRWVKLDMSYWNGDSLFAELTTARDAAVPLSQQDRSWFGVTDVIMSQKDQGPPAVSMREGIQSLILQLDPASVQNLDQLNLAISKILQEAVVAWRDGNTTDSQADLLDSALQAGLLPNSFNDFEVIATDVRRYRELEAAIPVPQRVPGLLETNTEDHPLFVRGDHKQPGEVIPRRFLEAIDESPYRTSASGRRELAEDVLRADNPFTRRVLVNRVWHHLFGEGLFRTPDNVGRMGDLPNHPELIDFLAIRFAEEGWSIKSLIREIMLSRAWQLDSSPTSEAIERDPENRFLTHAHLQRLPAESIRDSMLVVSDRLDPAMTGPSVTGSSDRRSIYVSVTRNQLDPFLREFDFPEPFATTGRRDVTNVPAQSLTLMNDQNVYRSAERGATELLNNQEFTSDSDRLEYLFVKSFSRRPTQREIDFSLSFLSDVRQEQLSETAELAKIETEISNTRAEIQTLLNRVVVRDANSPEISEIPLPFSSWDFQNGMEDALGGLNLSAPAEPVLIEEGAAVLNGRNYLTTPSLPITTTAATLEVWVQLSNLNQSGGGVMSLQANNGDVFNSIVFGEMQAGHWLSGSEFFKRTQAFGGQSEDQADQHPIQLLMTYAEDGTVTLYRDGQQYGQSYRADPHVFQSGNAFITLGVRHLPAANGRMLAGKIYKASFYDRALTADEALQSYQSASARLSLTRRLEALSESEREELRILKDREKQLRLQLQSQPRAQDSPDLVAWTEFIRGIFHMKEFLYLR